MQAVIDHFCRVNSCPKDAFTQHEAAAFDLWNKRNCFEWVTDLGEYQYLVQQAGELERPQ
jgi:hypothetical protein